MLRLVGAGEVAHHQPHRDPVEGMGLGREALDRGGRQAEPRHAAVHLQRRRQFSLRTIGCAAPRLDLLDAVEHRNDFGCGAGVLAARRDAVEHMDFCRAAQRGA